MKPRILVIDDEPDLVDSLVMALEDEFEVHSASNGRIALDRLTTEPFDVVLLDLMMPVISGEDLLRTLDGKLRPAIVVLSASRDLDETCALLGVTHYLQKPYRLPALLAKIADARRGSGGCGATSRAILGHDAADHADNPAGQLLPAAVVRDRDT